MATCHAIAGDLPHDPRRSTARSGGVQSFKYSRSSTQPAGNGGEHAAESPAGARRTDETCKR